MPYLTQASGKPRELRPWHPGARLRCVAGIVIFPLFAICFFLPAARARQGDTASAKVEGTVFVRDSAGNQSFVAGARVTLSGPTTLEAETDENGRYQFAAVILGTYTVEASSPGLKAMQAISVEALEVSVPLEMKPLEVTTSVVVKADPAETQNPAPSQTVSAETLRDAPNVNERFESSLPLFPESYVGLTGTSTSRALATRRAVSW